MDTFNELFNDGEIVRYKKGTTIISPQSVSTSVHLIKTGFVYGYSLHKKAKKIQNVLKAGEIFPLLFGITNSPSRFYTEALTDVELVSVEQESFFKKIFSDLKLSRNLIDMLATYLGVYVERVDNLEQDTVEKKLIGRILHFASRFGRKEKSTIFINLPLTHNFIAQSINVARENVSREIGKLEKERLLEFNKGYITVLDIEKLQKKLLGVFFLVSMVFPESSPGLLQ